MFHRTERNCTPTSWFSQVARCGLVTGLVLMLAACATSGSSATLSQSLIEVDREAEQAYRAGHFGHAVKLYEELVKAMPGSEDYWYQLGNAYVRANREGEAVRAYQQALALDGDNSRAWHNLGVLLLRQSQEAFLRGARSAHPDSLEQQMNQRQLDLLLSLPDISASAQSVTEQQGELPAHQAPRDER